MFKSSGLSPCHITHKFTVHLFRRTIFLLAATSLSSDNCRRHPEALRATQHRLSVRVLTPPNLQRPEASTESERCAKHAALVEFSPEVRKQEALHVACSPRIQFVERIIDASSVQAAQLTKFATPLCAPSTPIDNQPTRHESQESRRYDSNPRRAKQHQQIWVSLEDGGWQKFRQRS